jgi:DNA-binding CsgD family transcriptional regulator
MPFDPTEGFVDRIYEAAVVSETWPGVLNDITRIADAHGAVLIAVHGTSARWIPTSPEIDEITRYHYERGENERTRRLLAAQRAGFVTDYDVFTPDEIAAEPLFRDYLIPRGLGSGVATAIFSPSGDAFIFHAECAHASGPVSREVVARLDRARPHLARAALLSARLEMQRAQAAAEALELLRLPGAVLRHGGRLLAANNLLAELIPTVVQDRTARLTLVDPAADRLFSDALAQLASDFDSKAVRSIPIPASEGRGPLIVHVLPVRGAANDIFTTAASIVVLTPVAIRDAPAGVVQGLFDLTAAEARVASLIASGRPPREAAVTLGITEGTARTTLKRVFAKVGVSRQSELAALLSRLTLG